MKRLFSLLLLSLCALSARAANHPQALSPGSARAYPYNLVGQLLFNSGADPYVGSGTVVRPKSILTAGHNVYDPVGGWSTEVNYRRSNYGASALTDAFASHLYLLAGYQASVTKFGPDDVRSFAYDSAGAVFPSLLDGGHYALTAYSPLLLLSTYYRVAVGYGAEGAHTGDYPLFVRPTTSFTDTYGQFWETYSIYVEGGMSGGPLFSYYNGIFFVTGVVVSGSVDPESGGIRHIDPAAYKFIYTYLK